MKVGTVSVWFITLSPKATCHIKVHTKYLLNKYLLSLTSVLCGRHSRALLKVEQRVCGQETVRTWRGGCVKEGVCSLMARLGQVEQS